MAKLRIAVLVSGRGSNLQSIIDACASGEIPAEIGVVVSDKEKAYALERAGKAGIRAEYVPEQKDRELHEKAIAKIIDEEKCGLVCLAGYMKLVTRYFVSKYSGRLMNIHPSLLPSFGGAHGQRDALAYGAKVSGCTVHFVDEGMDSGPIIIQKVVTVEDNDTQDTLAARILKEEHKAYPEAIRLFAEDKLRIKGRRVSIKG